MKRERTKKKSDNRFKYRKMGLTYGRLAGSYDEKSATARRSTVRVCVRHKWIWEAVTVPPGRIKFLSGGHCSSIRSMVCSNAVKSKESASKTNLRSCICERYSCI